MDCVYWLTGWLLSVAFHCLRVRCIIEWVLFIECKLVVGK